MKTIRGFYGLLILLCWALPVVAQPLSIASDVQLHARISTQQRIVLEASGGAEPYAWTLASGNMPPGLMLSTDGVLAGIPSTAGTYEFGVRLVDGLAHSITENIVLRISPESEPIISTPGELDPLQTGRSGSYALKAGGGAPPYTWTADSPLPAGFTLAGDTLLARANAPGTQRLTLRVTDAAGQTDSRTFAVPAYRTAILVDQLTQPRMGEAYSQVLAAVGGTAPYVWSVAGGALPRGLTLDGDGVLAGVPEDLSPEDRCALISVRDASGQLSSRKLCLAVQQPRRLSILTADPDFSMLSVGEPTGIQLQAAGDAGSIAWRIVSGALPDGLALGRDGALSGKPVRAGTFTALIEARNAEGADQRTITLRVSELRVETKSIEGIAGASFTGRLVAAGGAAPFHWSIPEGSALPDGLSLSGDGVISGIPAGAGRVKFQVRVEDASGNFVVRDVRLILNETADGRLQPLASPNVTITTPNPLPLATLNVAYSQTLAASGTAPFTWALNYGFLPTGVSFVAGVVSGTPTTCGSYYLNVEVTDAVPTSASKNLDLGVPCPTPAHLSLYGSGVGNLGEVSVGASVQWNLYSSGGNPYYTISVAAGSTLPAGLTISSDPGGSATLSGMPTVAGSYVFSIQVTDGSGHSVVQAARLIVSPLTITSPTSYSLALNTALTTSTLTATGGTGGLTWSVVGSSLPAGLTLTSAGVLSGTPTETGTIGTNIRVTDSGGHTRTVPFSFFVSSGTANTLSISPSGNNVYTAVGQPLSYGFYAIGGSYTWSVAAGSTLPAGIALVSGQDYGPQLWGVPTVAGSYTFSIKVTDSAGNIGLRTINLIVSPLFDTSGDLNIGAPVLNTPYSRQLAVAGGTSPYTWALAAGSALPPGLTISASGVISGTPTFPGSATFTLAVTDHASNSANFTYTLNVAVFSITNPVFLPNATVNSAYSAAFAAIGGMAPYSFNYFAPTTTSPIFFSLTSSGNLSGTPYAAGEYDFSVNATDANANFTTKEFSFFSVNSTVAPLAVTSPAPFGETSAGALTNLTLSAMGGTPPYLWTVPMGSSLPPGMFLTSGAATPGVTNFSPLGYPGYNNLYGIPSTPGTYNFTLQVADAASHTATQSFSLVVSPISILNASLTGTFGVAYAHNLIATGGTGPYTWAVAAGSYLPVGLTLANGVISGTPMETGSLTFNITATDAASHTRTVPFTMYIASGTNCSPSFSTGPQLGNASVNEMFTAYLYVGYCGTNPSLSVVAGSSLPAGLQLQQGPNYQIWGVPTAAGNYTFGIKATDSSGNFGIRYFRLSVTGLINTTYSVAPGALGTAYSQTFTAAGGTGPYTWAVCSGSALPAGLTLSAAGVLSGTPTQQGTFNFSVCATDHNGAMASFATSLNIGAIAITTPSVLPNITIGQNYSQTIAASGGVPPYTWSLGNPSPNYATLPSGLTLNVLTGVISGKITCCAGSPFKTGITVTDSVGNTVGKFFGGFEIPAATAVTVPSIYSPNDALGTVPVGQPFSTSLSAYSTNGPYTWSVAAGSLPPGISVMPDPQNPPGFVLAGVPTTPGSYVFTLKVTDAASFTASQTYSLTVSSLFTTGNPPNGTVGTAYSFTFGAAGGTAPYTWSLLPGHPLPAGLSLSSAGVLSGTPLETGNSFTLRLRVTDSAGAAIAVNSYLYIATNTSQQVYFNGAFPMPAGFVQQEYNQTFTFSGGTGPYTWSLNSGSLPPGLQLLPGAYPGTSVSIWGEPTTPGTYSFTIKATDSAGNTGYRTPVITISPLANAVPGLPTGSVGQAYAQQLAVVGAAGPYTWSVLRGQYPVNPTCNGCFTYQDSVLPPGLTLSSAGSITGTPLYPGTFNFQVMALDNSGDPLVISYTIIVTPLTITNSSALPPATLNTAYSDTLTALGGTSPYTFTATNAPSLPAGLALSPAGVLSGTPTRSGIYSFGVSVSDSLSNSYANTFSVVVTPAALSPLTITWYGTAGYTTSSYLTTVASGTQIYTNFSGTGGQAPYTWSIPAGYALPQGMVLTSAGNLIGLAEIPGTFSFAVRLTDSQGNTATQIMFLTVSPLKIYPNLPQGTLGTAYTNTLVAIGGAPPYTFGVGPGSSLPAGLSLDGTGHITGTPTDTGQLSFDVRVTDVNGLTFVRTVTLFVAAGTSSTYTISGGPLPDAQPNVSYSQYLYANANIYVCCGNVSWTLAPGSSLPTGLSLIGSSNSATLSGTPTAPGHYSFRVEVMDSSGNLGFRTFTLNVSPVVNTSPSSATATVGVAFTQTVTVAGGSGPYTYSLAPGYLLPPGFTLNSATGAISGTAASPGQYTVGVVITDAGGNTTVALITITAGPLGITGADLLPNGQVGKAYSMQLTAAGGTAPYTWSLAPGSSLPAGLTLSSGGLISGTPTSTGLFLVNLVAVDSVYNNAARTLGLNVTGVLPTALSASVFSASIQTGTIFGSGYCCFYGFGGTPPYAWSLAGGSLPPGIVLSTDKFGRGALLGATQQPDNYTFLAKVTDANGVTAFSTGTLTVLGGALNATVNVPFSAAIPVYGGTSPYAFALAPNAVLPSGMALSAGGTLSGTPTDTGSQYFDVVITDAASKVTYETIPFNVNVASGPTVTVYAQSTANAAIRLTTVAQANLFVSAYGGTFPYVFSLANGSSLPPGLSLTSSSVVGAPTTAGTYTTVIQATDANNVVGSRTLTFVIGPQFQIFTRAFPTVPSGTPVNLTLNAAGGTTPYTWSVPSNSVLPPGLTLSPQGVLSGTPAGSGAFNFSATVVDSSTPQNQVTNSFFLGVSPVTQTTSGPLPDATAGAAYSAAFTATGGALPYTFYLPSTTAVPSGMTLSNGGTLSGAAGAPGAYTFTVTVADAKGWITSNTYHLYVVASPAPFPLVALPLANATTTVLTGAPASIVLPAAGGTPPYTWSVAANSMLPPGMSIQQGGTLPVPAFTPGDAILTGTIGVPGIYSFTLNLTDSASPAVVASRTYQLIASSLTTANTGSTSGTVGTAMQYSLLPAGGTAPYTVSIFRGALPNGLSLTSAGVVSGTPVDPGGFTVTFLVSDSSVPSLYVYRSVSFFIGAASGASNLQWLTSATLLGGPYARNGTFQIGFSGINGTQPYTFSLPMGAVLPAGLSLKAGVLSGSPTTAGKYTFPVTLTDAANTSLTRMFYMEVSPIAVTPTALSGATQGTAYSANLTAAGGTGPLSLAASSLPAGLSLTAGGALAGSPTFAGTQGVVFSYYDNATPANSLSLNYPLSVAAAQPPPPPPPPPSSNLAFSMTSAAFTSINYSVPAAQSVMLTLQGSSSPASYSTSVGCLSTGGWLTVSPAAGTLTGQTALQLSVNPAGLGVGVYTCLVNASTSSPAGVTNPALTVTLNVAPLVTVNPASLSFSWNVGDPNPAAQNVSVSSMPTGAMYAVSAATTSNGNWLTVPGNAGGPAPNSFPVSINLGSLGVGNYSGSVTVKPAIGPAFTIPVTLAINKAQTPKLSVSPLTEQFALSTTAAPAHGQLVVSNTGGGTLSFGVAVSSDKGWLSLPGSGSGTATSTSPQSFAYVVDPTGLKAGSYSGQITVSDTNSPAQAVVNISLTVSATQSLVLSRGGLTFITSQGGPAAPAQTFEAFSEGAGTLNWTVQPQVFYNPQLKLPSTPNWLSAAPTAGTSVGGQAGATINVSTNASGLPPGQYFGSVTVAAPGADNTPQSVSVSLTVAPPAAPTPPPIQFGAGGVILVGTAGGRTPQQQSVTLFNPTLNPVNYSTTATSGGWLSVNPATGALSPGVNSVSVSADFSSLTQGVQTGSVNITTDDGAANIQVDAIATSSTGSARPAAFPLLAAACTAGKPGLLIAVLRQPVGLASITASIAQLVQAQVVDGCGNPVTASAGGAVQVNFSNGDPSIHLVDVGAGIWEGTWTPAHTGAIVTVSAVASEGALAQAGPASATLAVTAANSAGPGMVTGFANAAAGASAIAQSGAPGSYVAIYGTNLADADCSAPAALAGVIPLPTTLNGTQVLLGGMPMPLSFACQTQINAVVPRGIATNALAQLIVVRDATRSVPVRISVAGLQPGIFTADSSGSGQGIAEIVGTTLLAGPAGKTSRPVQSGAENLAVFATGLGPVAGPSGETGPADGTAASSTLLFSTSATVTATIGGVQVPVLFSGLTPGLVSLYQVNVAVPSGVPTGNAVPLVITATDSSGAVFVSNTATIAVQ